MEVFDKDGNPITEGIYTKEQVDQMIAEAQNTKDAPAADSKPVDLKPVETPATAATAEEVAALKQQLTALASVVQTGMVSKYSSALTADQKPVFQSKFDSLSGYGNTPEEIERRASDAFLLATGTKFGADAINMSNLSPVGNKAPAPQANKELKTEDKPLADLLGNKPEDYQKYGKEA